MPETPADEKRPAHGVVETMLDRPVAQVVRFVGRLLTTWLRGLVDPWRLGLAAVRRPEGLAPPFAFLVVTLFLAGVGRRLLWAIATVPLTDEVSLVEDVRVALGDVSLMSATLVTLPCVVIAALGSRVVSLALGGRGRLDRDPIVTAACYAIGWQAGGVAVVVVALIALQRVGYEPSGAMTKELNATLPWLALIGMLWGAMILAPSLRARLPARLWAAPAALTLAVVVTVPTFLASFATLGVSTDLSSAARRRVQRNIELAVGDLQAELLRVRRLDRPGRLELTVAYTSLAEDVVIVPRPDGFGPPSVAHERFSAALRVSRSSIDSLPDRALVIGPGETRVAVFEVEESAESPTTGHDPFAAPYFTRKPDGLYTDGEAVFWRKVATDERATVLR